MDLAPNSRCDIKNKSKKKKIGGSHKEQGSNEMENQETVEEVIKFDYLKIPIKQTSDLIYQNMKIMLGRYSREFKNN